MERKVIIFIGKIIFWVIGLYIAAYYSFHTIYFIISGFYLMFTNLGKRKEGTLSAYSVFNQNFERLHGTMDGTQLFKGGLKQQRTPIVLEKQKKSEKSSNIEDRQQYFKNTSKYGNKACFCGSQIKFKKCCLISQRKRQQQEREKRIKSN